MTRLAKRITSQIAAAVLLASAHSHAAQAREHARPAEELEIARCIRIAAGGKPWLERTLWALRDQEGGRLGSAVRNTNGSHDFGPLQINSWWVPRLALLVGRRVEHVRDWLRGDACFNVAAARWIFLTALAESRDYWKAIGTYHSPTRSRQHLYAMSVANKLMRRFGPGIFQAPLQTATRTSVSTISERE